MKIKVFKSGKYPQGEYDKTRVKNIFTKAKETDAIFLHSSLWAKDEKPLNLGKFGSYEFKESNGEVEVFADLQLNETGKKFYQGKVLNGVSVELPNDELTKIAILPNKVNPAIEGAEFQASPIFMEFQEIEEKKPKGEDKTMEKTEVLKGLTKEEVQAQSDRLGIVITDKPKAKTPEEMEQDITARLTKENENKTKVAEFMKEHDKKIVPAFKPFFEKIVEESLKSEINWEFNKKDTSLFEGLQEFMKKMPEFSGFTNYSKDVEFEEQSGGKDESVEAMRKAFEDTKKRYGGNE